MSVPGNLGKIDRTAGGKRRVTPVRFLLPLGWILAAVGYYGPWIAHRTAALVISGVDMGEFVKFLPGIPDGTLKVTRELFYLPPVAVVVGVAFLVGSRWLRYPWPLRVLFLLLAVPVSLQLLPPAWSPAGLRTAEFRLQAVALGICWLLLAGFWLLGNLPPWPGGVLSAALSLAAGGITTWQFMIVKPAIDGVYGTPSPVGWGYFLCMTGLAVTATAGAILVLRTRSRTPWPGK